MDQLFPLFIWLPLLAFLISLLAPANKEAQLSGIAIFSIGLHFLGLVVFAGMWVFSDFPTLNIKHLLIFEADNNKISIDFYFDKVTAAFALVGSLLSFLVAVYSRYFIHREGGYKQFFSTLLLFFLGYNMLVFSGNYETLFVGWEVVGVCTFLLVSFYRNRYLPVKNSLKVISIYRLGDICLILAMWVSHHVWHENIVFLKLNDGGVVAAHLQTHYAEAVIISLLVLIAAAVKSAQLPFSSWLPRAMEGPTTSSAIFYGSLSVHIGVFVLLRTYPYWQGLEAVKYLIAGLGLTTSLVAISISKLQSSLKPKIAYSSIAQIGLMFIEVAFGFHHLALFHFAGNACLRTYQLLVSPSMQHYLVHHMFYNFVPKQQPVQESPLAGLRNSFYLLSLKEWNLDFMFHRFFWTPFKKAGQRLQFLSSLRAAVIITVIYVLGLLAHFYQASVPAGLFQFLPYVYSFAGLLFILKSFAEKGNALWAWFYVIAGQLFMTLAVALQNVDFGFMEIGIYYSGISVAAIVGAICLIKIHRIDNDINLRDYHGYIYEKPQLGLVFLISCLGLIGLPFTPTFIGIDLLFNHIHKRHLLLVLFTSLGFLFMELAILRVYARIFMGLYKKADHAIAFRSS